MINLTVLGCNGLYPTNGNNTSGYLVKTPSLTLVIDMGSGVFSALRNLVSPEEVSAIFISHLHHDHIADLGVYNYYLEFLHKNGRLKNKIKLLVKNDESAVYQLIKGLNYFEICDYNENEPTKIGGATLSFYKMKHPVLTHGVCVSEGGKTLSYTADSALCDNLKKVIQNSDLTLCHAPFLKEEAGENKPHVSAYEVVKIAKESGKKIIISHLLPDKNNLPLFDEVKEFEGFYEFAKQGATYTLK